MTDALASRPGPAAADAVKPRRPARTDKTLALPRVEWRARPQTVTNLFADIFDAPPRAPEPATARERGRARMQALATARDIAAAPALHNLWHDAFDDPAEGQSAAAPTPILTAEVIDLARVRAALYDASTRDTTTRQPQVQSVQMRLAVQAMNGTLIVVAAPVGAAVMTYSLLRGEDLRLTGNALAVCGSLMALIQTGLQLV